MANTAEKHPGRLQQNIDVAEFERCFLTEQADDTICLDVRGAQNAAPYVNLFGERWLNLPQETLRLRFDEIPKDKRLLVVCNSGCAPMKLCANWRPPACATPSTWRAGGGPEEIGAAGIDGVRRQKQRRVKVSQAFQPLRSKTAGTEARPTIPGGAGLRARALLSEPVVFPHVLHDLPGAGEAFGKITRSPWPTVRFRRPGR